MPENELRQTILDAIIDCSSSPFVLMLTDVRRELERPIEIVEVLRELRAMCAEGLVESSNEPAFGDGVDFDSDPPEAIAGRYDEWFQENADDLNLYWDPFGLEFAITDEGRLGWHRNLPSDYEEPPFWRVVSDAEGNIVIYAQDEECAAEVFKDWTTESRERRMASAISSPDPWLDWESRTTESLPEFALNINRVIRDGVRVTIKGSQPR